MRLLLTTLCLSALCALAQAKDAHLILCDFAGAKPLAWSWVGPLVGSLEKGQAPDGATGMAIAVSAGAGTTQALLKTSAGLEALGPGAVVEFKLWIPAGSAFSGFEPYSSDANGHWAGVWTGDFHAGQWNSFTLRVPCDAAVPLSEIGLYLFASAAMQTHAYLDAVTYVPGSQGAKDLKKPVLRALKELP